LEDTNFENLMADFLYSPTGSQYRGLFKFSQNFECGKNLPNIEVRNLFLFKKIEILLCLIERFSQTCFPQLVMVPFRFRDFLKTNDQVQVMEELNKIISATRRSMVPNFGNEQVILKMWSPAMVGWETDKVMIRLFLNIFKYYLRDRLIPYYTFVSAILFFFSYRL